MIQETVIARRSRVAAYLALTKPRIIELLLVTTVPTMVVAERGLPSGWLVLATLVGGALAAGGANAINMYVDRDIDKIMKRTRGRPLVTGEITPRNALVFAVVLELAAAVELWLLVNPLSALLAVSATLFYVFVYTLWLKRKSSSNIVIGGAAGAVPVLVGWAAVTGSLGLAPLVLFAIIFYWTPPHFWALALVKQGEYARAGVPMLPVVRGEQRTKFEMLAYTLILLPLTLMPAFFGALGLFYAVAAALLGARLIWYCIRLLRESSTIPLAWRMYRYSLLYLALLFVAMGIDRALPFGRLTPDKVLILDRPDREIVIPSGMAQGE